MAQNTFVVKNHADANVTFRLQSQDLKKAAYINASTSLSAPESCEISHDLKQPGQQGTDRHTLSFKRGLVDGNGLMSIASATITLSIPRSSALGAGDIDALDLVSFVTDFLSDANVALLVDGVTP